MGTEAVVVVEPILDDEGARVLKDLNSFSLRHSSRKRPLNDSIYAFCVGLPGSMKCKRTFRSRAQHAIAIPVSSVPLSMVIVGVTPARCDRIEDSRNVNTGK